MREKLINLVKRAIADWEHGDVSERIADHLLANGVTFAKDNNVPSWIPVTERLPEDECRCLVIDAAGDIEMDVYDGEGGFRLDHQGALQHPSHWMPLPEAPKEVE